MTEIAYPRRTLLNLDARRTVVAVEPHMAAIPAYAEKPTMQLDDMRKYAKKNGGGVIMQQDEPRHPPFQLTQYSTQANTPHI